MKPLLLDTHAMLWMLLDDPRLPKSSRRYIEKAEVLAYSLASLWEIALKLSNKGFDFSLPPDWHEMIPQEMTRIAARRLDITPAAIRIVQDLPPHHHDPFDRMIIAQAHIEKCGILSKDPQFAPYKIKVIW